MLICYGMRSGAVLCKPGRRGEGGGGGREEPRVKKMVLLRHASVRGSQHGPLSQLNPGDSAQSTRTHFSSVQSSLQS